MNTRIAKSQEDRIRRLARHHGYALRKSLARKQLPRSDNHGEYMLINPQRNTAVLGERFNATLDDIEAFFDRPKAA